MALYDFIRFETMSIIMASAQLMTESYPSTRKLSATTPPIEVENNDGRGPSTSYVNVILYNEDEDDDQADSTDLVREGPIVAGIVLAAMAFLFFMVCNCLFYFAFCKNPTPITPVVLHDENEKEKEEVSETAAADEENQQDRTKPDNAAP